VNVKKNLDENTKQLVEKPGIAGENQEKTGKKP
jgi:hypothetical protein